MFDETPKLLRERARFSSQISADERELADIADRERFLRARLDRNYAERNLLDAKLAPKTSKVAA